MKPAQSAKAGSASHAARGTLPLPVIAGRIALHALAWCAWCLLLLWVDLEQSSDRLSLRVFIDYVALTLIGFALPWYGCIALFRRLRASLPMRLLAVAIMAVAWSVCLLPISRAMGLRATFLESITDMAFVTAIALGSSETLRGLRARRRIARLEQLRIAAEQQLLGAQLAPHTLFNLLNTLYAVSLTRPAELAPLVQDLANMMTPLTVERPAELHSAAEEWRFIEAYRRFALIRLDPHSTIELAFEGDPGNAIPAFLTATLFENAVKHGMDSAGKVDIDVNLNVHAQGFLLRMSNRLSDVRNAPPGMLAGVDLVRRRLQYLYPYRHRFEAAPQGRSFEVLMEAW